MPLVNLPDGTQASFPDDMSHDQITSVIQQHLSSQPKQDAPAEPSMLDKAGSVAGAVVGGLANGGADIAEGLGDTPTFIMKHLGVISPETADKLYAATKQNAAMFRPDSNSNDAISTSVKDHPNVATIAKYGIDMASLAGAAKAAIPGLADIAASSTIPQALGRIGGSAVGQGLLGQAAADPEHKDAGFALGAIASPIMDVAAGGLQKAGAKQAAVDSINDTLAQAKANKAANYAAVQNAPFATQDKVNANGVSHAINQYLQTNADKLSQIQTNVLTNAADSLADASSHSDTLKVLQQLGGKTKAFSGANASDDVYQAYNGFKSQLQDDLTTGAARTGNADALSNANNNYVQTKVLGKIFKGLTDDSSSLSPGAASNQLNVQINALKDKPGMQDTVQLFKGIQKTMAGLSNSSMPGVTAQHYAGAAAGSAAGYEEGGAKGAAVGGIAGLVGAPMAVHALQDMAASPQGKAILRGLAHPGVTTKNIQSFIRSLTAAGVAKQINNTPQDGTNGQ